MIGDVTRSDLVAKDMDQVRKQRAVWFPRQCGFQEDEMHGRKRTTVTGDLHWMCGWVQDLVQDRA